MKRIFILFTLMIACLSINSEEKVSSYSMSFFDGTTYDVESSQVKNGTFTYFVYGESNSTTDGECGISLKSSNIEEFISTLRSLIPKYKEWTKTAKDNNVTSFDKDFGIKLPKVNCFFKYGSKWCFDNGWKFAPYFKVTSDGECLIVIHSGKLTASTNQYMKHNGVYFVFASEAEVEEFIKAIDPSLAVNITTENENKDALFK